MFCHFTATTTICKTGRVHKIIPHPPWFHCGQSQGQYWQIAWDSASDDSVSSNQRRHPGLERNHRSAHPQNHTHGLVCACVGRKKTREKHFRSVACLQVT